MTLREMVNEVGIDDDPLGCAFVIAGFLRTAAQKEPSTFEGECASINKLHQLTGRDVSKPETIRWWLDDCEPASSLEVPDWWWLEICKAQDRDELWAEEGET
jgi:hypothetical protein